MVAPDLSASQDALPLPGIANRLCDDTFIRSKTAVRQAHLNLFHTER